MWTLTKYEGRRTDRRCQVMAKAYIAIGLWPGKLRKYNLHHLWNVNNKNYLWNLNNDNCKCSVAIATRGQMPSSPIAMWFICSASTVSFVAGLDKSSFLKSSISLTKYRNTRPKKKQVEY